MKYKKVINKDMMGNDKVTIFCDLENDTIISFLAEENNAYYQDYLKWLNEGNTPLPADE